MRTAGVLQGVRVGRGRRSRHDHEPGGEAAPHRLRKWERGVAKTSRAELADGRRVEGVLFAGELIWHDDLPTLAGAELH